MNKYIAKRTSIIFLILSFAFLNTTSSFAATETPNISGLIVAKGKLSQDHKTTSLGYDLTKNIPMGGVHHPGWATCKAYTTPVAAEYAIHSMEHGAVWIAYNSTLKNTEVAKLDAIAKNDPYLLLTSVKDAPNLITVTSWGFQIKAKNASDPRIKLFIKTFKNSKYTPELGAPCQQGIEDPKVLAKPQPLKK